MIAEQTALQTPADSTTTPTTFGSSNVARPSSPTPDQRAGLSSSKLSPDKPGPRRARCWGSCLSEHPHVLRSRASGTRPTAPGSRTESRVRLLLAAFRMVIPPIVPRVRASRAARQVTHTPAGSHRRLPICIACISRTQSTSSPRQGSRGTSMYIPQLFETISVPLHAERITHAQRAAWFKGPAPSLP